MIINCIIFVQKVVRVVHCKEDNQIIEAKTIISRTAASYSRFLAMGKIMYWFVPVSTFQQEWNQ
jgi:hypothetical protein